MEVLGVQVPPTMRVEDLQGALLRDSARCPTSMSNGSPRSAKSREGPLDFVFRPRAPVFVAEAVLCILYTIAVPWALPPQARGGLCWAHQVSGVTLSPAAAVPNGPPRPGGDEIWKPWEPSTVLGGARTAVPSCLRTFEGLVHRLVPMMSARIIARSIIDLACTAGKLGGFLRAESKLL